MASENVTNSYSHIHNSYCQFTAFLISSWGRLSQIDCNISFKFVNCSRFWMALV